VNFALAVSARSSKVGERERLRVSSADSQGDLTAQAIEMACALANAGAKALPMDKTTNAAPIGIWAVRRQVDGKRHFGQVLPNLSPLANPNSE
jgi:hypothetical protein